jgi:hypothetical protein
LVSEILFEDLTQSQDRSNGSTTLTESDSSTFLDMEELEINKTLSDPEEKLTVESTKKIDLDEERERDFF